MTLKFCRRYFLLFRKLSLRDNWLGKSAVVATILAHRRLSYRDASFSRREAEQCMKSRVKERLSRRS